MNLEADSHSQPERWEPNLHKRHGILKWDPKRFMLYRTMRQLSGMTALLGREIFNDVKNLQMLNANCIDFFKRHQKRILTDEHREFVFISWGTIYYERTSGREPFVRGLEWNGHEWQEIDLPVDGYGFSAKCAALMYVHPGVKAHGNDAQV